MWITISVSPDDPRLCTKGSRATCSRELVDDMNDRPPTLEWLYDITVKCNSFDGCPVLEFDEEALYEHFESEMRDG